MTRKLHTFQYAFRKGAGSEEALMNETIKEGNCRLALQDYYYICENMYLTPDQVFLPQGFKQTGTTIQTFDTTENFFKNLKKGDVIYAERLKNQKKENVYKNKSSFHSKDDWITSLHSAVFLGKLDRDILSHLPQEENTPFNQDSSYIWHATAVAGGTVLWTAENFSFYYQLVIAKRILL